MVIYIVAISGKVEDAYTSFQQALDETGLNYWTYRRKIGQTIACGEITITPIEITKQKKGKRI